MDFFKIKPLAAIGVSVLLMGFFGFLINGYVADSGASVLLVIIVGVAALALSVFKALIIRDHKLLWMGAVLDSSTLVLLSGFSGVLILVMFVAVALFFFWSARRGESMARQQLKINLGSFVRAAAPMAITGIALVISVIYATRMISPEFTVSRSTVQSALAPAEPILRGFIPGFSLKSSISQLVSQGLTGAMSQFGGGLVGGLNGFGALAGVAASAQVTQTLSQTLGVRVGMNDTALDVLYRAINAQLAKIPQTVKPYIRALVGGLVFLTIKSFGFIFVYITQFLVWLLFFIAKSIGFARVTTEQVSREAVEL